MKLAFLFVVIFATVAFGQVQVKLKDEVNKSGILSSKEDGAAVEIRPLAGGMFSQLGDGKLLEKAKEKGKELLDKVKGKGKELKDEAKKIGNKLLDKGKNIVDNGIQKGKDFMDKVA